VSLNAGTQGFTWSGQGNNGQTWPDGTYKLTVTATGASGQAVNVSTQVQGVVSGVNLSSNPPTLTVNGQNFQISQVTSITH
jgi:flagellar basal-body rod modification protein FlgD